MRTRVGVSCEFANRAADDDAQDGKAADGERERHEDREATRQLAAAACGAAASVWQERHVDAEQIDEWREQVPERGTKVSTEQGRAQSMQFRT